MKKFKVIVSITRDIEMSVDAQTEREAIQKAYKRVIGKPIRSSDIRRDWTNIWVK